MSKNIIIIDGERGELINNICNITNYNIILAVVDNFNQIKKFKYQKSNISFFYPKIFETEDDFYKVNKNNYNLTYEEINRYRNTQYKVNNYLSRVLYDKSSIDNRYYFALSFFLDFFKKNKIDFVLSSDVEHGDTTDSIIFDIAKNYHIPTYNITPISSCFDKEICALFRHNDKKFIPITSMNVEKIDISLFIKEVNQSFFKLKNENKSLQCSKLKKWVYIYSFYREAFKGFEKKDLCNRKFIFSEYFKKYESIRQSVYVYNLFKLYEKISEDPEYGDFYIYYPLHQEPEASIQNRASLNNQLFIIEKIAELLPENWKLYVKEHPSEFFIYDKYKYYYKNINLFRSPEFYTRIKKIKNVKLIKYNEPSDKLIDNATAVASICGTVLLESVLVNKPVLIFGDNMNIIEKLTGVYNISCINDLKNAIQQIKTQKNPYNMKELQSLFDSFVFYRYKNSSFYIRLLNLCGE